MSRASLGWDVARRDALRERVSRVLGEDDRVDKVELHGSLASGRADIYSDIDLVARLRPGLTDRDYFIELPEVMDAVGPRLIDGLSFTALPNYAGTFYFDSVPLLWHVDIGCIPAGPKWHVDGADLFTMKRWEQRFKMWIEAVKRLLRAESQPADLEARAAFEWYINDMRARVAKRQDVSSVVGEPRHQLRALIDMEVAWHRDQGIDGDRYSEHAKRYPASFSSKPLLPRWVGGVHGGEIACLKGLQHKKGYRSGLDANLGS